MENMSSKKTSKSQTSSLYLYENEMWSNDRYIYGIDEVGRGPLAGPLVVGSAALNKFRQTELIKDSKLLNPKQLFAAYSWLLQNSKFSIAILNHRLIDKYNIHQATLKAMRRSVCQLLASSKIIPDVAIVDSMPLAITNKKIRIEYFNFAESKSASVAAASIAAKVTRDNIMARLNNIIMGYGFDKHKGYGTKLHIDSINDLKNSIIHRKSFVIKANNA